MKFVFYKQLERMDCGATCLKIIAKYYNKNISIVKLRKLSETNNEGTSLKKISDAATKIGFRTISVKINFNKLANEVPLPCIVHWRNNHFVVIYEINKKVSISDPSSGLRQLNKQVFLENWIGRDATESTKEGIVLLLEPTTEL